ncbi:hypothetical protein M0802_001734 [Mischocyttarus mexicanus]|nr:hypothetical protein M0802_001734 [Mischocyttarus mexicanus]
MFSFKLRLKVAMHIEWSCLSKLVKATMVTSLANHQVCGEMDNTDDDLRTAVELYIYDLSKGMASLMSNVLIGRHLEGIWHTGIVAYGREYFFGPAGIQSVRPGGTHLREPQKIEKIGETYLPYSVFLEYINGLGTSTFAPGTYNLFKHNCNTFTEEVSNFLAGTGIPKYILDLPEEILQTPFGQTLGPLIESLSSNANAGFTVGQRFVEARIDREASPEYQLLNTEIEEARLNSIALEERRNVINEKLAKKDRKKKKKKKEKKEKGAVSEMQAANGATMDMSPSDRVMQMEEEEKREQEEKKRQRDPPIVFKDTLDVKPEYETLVKCLEGKLNDEERTCLTELRQYVLENEGSWALGDYFLNFVGRILYDKSLITEARVKLLNVLSVAALKDDVILLLHQDRREHILMNYAFDIDRHPPEEQLPLAEFLANMFENLSSSEWLLYISEWQHQNQSISNIRVTTKVAVHSLLSNSFELQTRGAAIIHNLACKEFVCQRYTQTAMSVPRKDSILAEGAKKKKKRNIIDKLSKFILILQWLPNYTQFQAISDVIAGITIGLTMIPQSIAYAALAGLTAQYGLYSAFLGSFVYVLLGTTKEVSIGPTSLMSLLVLEYTRDMPTDFVILLTFLAGCVELAMGFLVDFISIPVTSAFTSAAAIIIIAAQIQGLLGLRYKSHTIVDTLRQTYNNIEKVHLPDIALSFSCIVFLLLFKTLQNFRNKSGSNEITRIKKILWFFSIGRNALIVLITSIISFNLTTLESSPFTLSGKVEPGLPAVSLPPFSSQIGNRTYTFFDMCSHYGSGILMVPIIAVLTNVAIAKAFASGNSLNAKQEMLTLGICNILGSFFSSMPTCGAFTRSAVSSTSGVQTPMAGLYTGILTLLALSFLTPYFYYIPRATLASVLVSAVLFMVDLRIFKVLWKGSRKDAIAAITTFVICILCNIEIGLLCGAALNIVFLLHPSARPKLSIIECKTDLGNEYLMLIPDTGFYYPAVDFLTTKLKTIAIEYEKRKVPLVLDCERFQGFDYTAIQSMERLSKQLNSKKRRLWLLNVKPEAIQSISILSDDKYFLFISNRENIHFSIDGIKKNTDEHNVVDEKCELMKNGERENLEMEDCTNTNEVVEKTNGDVKDYDKITLYESNA